MPRVFLDMDGVLADFDGMKDRLGITGDQLVDLHGAFLMLEPVIGAVDAVPAICAMGYDVFIASRPAPQWPTTYADKAAWVHKVFPALAHKLILTQDKGLLGRAGDILVDDRPEKANCVSFPGHIIHFGGPMPATPLRDDRWFFAQNWDVALQCLKFLRG